MNAHLLQCPVGHRIESSLEGWAKPAVRVSGLKNNPSQAWRQAKFTPVVVLKRNQRDAVFVERMLRTQRRRHSG